MTDAPMKTIESQPSFILETPQVEAAVTRRAAMLAPVTFYRDADPVQPYAIAPWANDPPDADLPAILRVLRGDFMCSAFGGNQAPIDGRHLPVHGETANEEWTLASFERGAEGVALTLTMDLKVQGGRCDAKTALIEGHNVVYQRHDFSGIDGPINPGHHATLRFPEREGAGRLSFAPHVYAHTFIEPTESEETNGRSCFQPDAEVADLTAVPLADGSTGDVTRYPARRGCEDIMILVTDPGLALAWSAVTFPEEGYVWFTLRDPKRLPSTLLWISNGGRDAKPWNGRHFNVMGVEDMTGFFHVGLAGSSQENLLTKKGYTTCFRLKPDETLAIPYIQGVARVPEGFDRVASIEPGAAGTVTLIAESGARQTVPCRTDFVKTGRLDGLM